MYPLSPYPTNQESPFNPPCDSLSQPPTYHCIHGTEPLVKYSIKSVAVSIAWFIQRVVSAFHSAIRGSHMFANNVLEYLTIMGYLQKTQREAMMLDTVIAPVLALIGLWYQFSQGFSLTFPLNIILLPFSMCEWFLMWAVSS